MTVHCTPFCPRCGSEDTTYRGIDDGRKDYGDHLFEQWECLYCGKWFEEEPEPEHLSWQQRAIEEFLAEDADEH